MTRYPALVEELLARYSGRPVVDITQYVDEQVRRTGLCYGSLMVPVDAENYLVLVTHTYELIGIRAEDWTIPSGKLEASETFEEAAIRETIEETGMICEITALFKVFHHIHVYRGEKVAEWYMPVFIGKIIEETSYDSNNEIKEIARFSEPPTGFAGELNKHYEALMDFIKSI